MGEKKTQEMNSLTGLYNERSFFEKSNELLHQIKPDTYFMVAIDIEHFRLFNKIYGREEGDYLLEYVADCLRSILTEWNGIAGYLGGDNFGILIPQQSELIKRLERDISKGIKKISNTVGFLPAFGVYHIHDTHLPADVIYDRAAMALTHIFGNYTNRICHYEDSMFVQIEEEIMLLSEIQAALENQEFTFFVQPQCDISTGKIVGAESLVRWFHHSKGMIPPGVFIPVLEKNGFIADLDRYVWDKVCAWIRSWLDRGFHSVPISINVSRIDIFSMNVPDYLMQLMDKYQLEPSMLKVEITESAYTENNEQIRQTVKKLKENGFLVMMDDFGSGYSSLNMLKNVAVDVLKIDMRFLDIQKNENESEKGIGILESVVNMSRQIGVPVIVEGVETKNQEDFLVGMGCRYTQGFYYYKPLPINEFEKLLADERKLDFEGMWSKQVEPLHIREFMDDNLFSDTMLNNLLGATAFYDLYENSIEITRMNDQYYELFAAAFDAEGKKNINKLWTYVAKSGQIELLSILEQAYNDPLNGAQGYVNFIFPDEKVRWIYLKVFFLKEKEGHKLFYSSLTDMTFLKEEKQKSALATQQVKDLTERQHRHMEEYYGDIPCAMCVVKLILEENGESTDYELIYANRKMEQTCGSIQRLKYLASRMFLDKGEQIVQILYKAAYLGEEVKYSTYSSAVSRYIQMALYQFEYGYCCCMLWDVTYSRIHEKTLHQVMEFCREVYFIRLQEHTYRMMHPDEEHLLERGVYEDMVERWFASNRIRSDDEEGLRKFLSIAKIEQELMDKEHMEYKCIRNGKNHQNEWCIIRLSVSERKNNVPVSVVMMIYSIDTLMNTE